MSLLNRFITGPLTHMIEVTSRKVFMSHYRTITNNVKTVPIFIFV